MFDKENREIELSGGPLTGQSYVVPPDTETIRFARDASNLSAGCYIYGKDISLAHVNYFRYIGQDLGRSMNEVMELSSKIV